MQTAWIWLLISTLFFVGGLAYVVLALRSGRYKPSLLNMAIMACGFVAQCGFLYLRGQELGRCPITTPAELLVFVSWSIVGLYFLLGRAFRLSLLGAFTAPLVALFQLFALPFLREPAERNPADDYWLEMHASVSLLAYGAFALACIAGVMFLVQNRMLKRAQLEALSWNLPDIRHLGQAIVRLIGIGLILLSLGIASAFGMAHLPSGLHLALSLTVWLAYAALLGLRILKSLPTQKIALAAVFAFILPVATLMMISH